MSSVWILTTSVLQNVIGYINMRCCVQQRSELTEVEAFSVEQWFSNFFVSAPLANVYVTHFENRGSRGSIAPRDEYKHNSNSFRLRYGSERKNLKGNTFVLNKFEIFHRLSILQQYPWHTLKPPDGVAAPSLSTAILEK